jgi:hypothetical protein
MLRFPDRATLRLALIDETVPAAVRRGRAVAAFDGEALLLRPDVPLSDAARSELRLLGVAIDAAGPAPTEPVRCWHQLLDLEPCRAAQSLPPGTAVLFEVNHLALWPRLVSEIRRLAPQQRSLAWREVAAGRVLLRVISPPLYSLFRALERDACADQLTAFVEQSPRVWVELGWRHPVGDDIQPPDGQVVLIRSPREWSFLDDGPFQQELVEVSLPEIPASATEEQATCRLHVPLRLVRREQPDSAELWVLRERPFEQLAELLRDADDLLLAGLSIAALQDREQPVVVLRVRPGKHRLPVLVLEAESYRSYLKLPNLFLPVGHRLQPALRRDAVRELLARDPGEVTWLALRPGGAFVPERVSEKAFTPLVDLVEYVQELPARHLDAWVQAGRFDLQPFAPRDEEMPVDWRDQFRKPPPPPADDDEPPPPNAGLLERIGRWFRSAIARLPGLRPTSAREEERPSVSPAARTVRPGAERKEPVRPDPVADAVQKFLQPVNGGQSAAPPPPAPGKYRSVEERFLQIAGPLDAPERVAIWPKLAGFYQAEKKWTDAAVCWMNALWESDKLSPLWLWGWFHCEARAARWNEDDIAGEVERCLIAPVPDVADVRAMAAYPAWAVHQSQPLADFTERLGRIAQYLQTNEHLLPVRGAWLAWLSLSGLAGGDVLSLARARDRLLERLFRTGVNLDQDLPSFLRFAGQGGKLRFEPIRDWLVRQREPIHRWIDALHEYQPPDLAPNDRNELTTARMLGKQPPFGPAGEAFCTRAYADLILSWGLARLGAASEASQLWKQARTILATRDQVHRFLLEAFGHRIEQILDGRPAEGPLPPALLDELQHMPEMDRYKIDWLRQQSRILEPYERIDPFRGDVQRDYFDNLNPMLARLPEIVDRRELKQRIAQLLEQAPDTAQSALPRILKAALEQAPRIDESFAIDLLGRVSDALEEMPAAVEAAPLLEKALFVAAHFEQTVYVQQFLGRFQYLLDRRHGPQAARAFASLAEQSFRGLRKLGMRDEIDRLLKQMADVILQGQSLPNLRARMGVNIAGVLPTLLHVAGVWFYEGNDTDAMAVLDEVRSLLFSNRLPAPDQANLAKAYATSLGQAPAAVALDRLEELFRKLNRVHDSLTTRSHFSLAQLGVIEAVVVAVVDANFTLGATVRRWLDEDEYLMRRRIHRDLKAVMAQTV